MRNRFVAFFVLFVTLTVSVSAKAKVVKEPKNNEVILVGRISFSTDMDKDFLFKAFSIPEKEQNYKDIISLPYFSTKSKIVEGEKKPTILADKAKDITAFQEQAWAIEGDYFFVKYELNSDRILYLTSATLFISAASSMPVKLPLNMKITVPEGEKFIYIGDIDYSATGFAFDITRKISDNFDDAQTALNGVTKKPFQLSRANPEELSDEFVKNIYFRYEHGGFNFLEWNKLLKDYLVKKQ